MNEPGIKLTTYFGERDRTEQAFLADALFDVYERHRMRTSVLLRGASGFGPRHQLQSDRLLTLSESLPAVSIAVDTRARVESALPDVLRVAKAGILKDISAEVSKFEVWNDIYPGPKAAVTECSKVYGMPVGSNSLALFSGIGNRLFQSTHTL